MKTTIKLGNKVMVSDPCYGLGTWCQGVLDGVLPGNYNYDVEYSDEGFWGVRVGAIEVRHQDYNDAVPVDLEKFEIGVDSGQAGIFDYEYYAKYHDDCEVCPHVDDDWYDRVGDITLSRLSAGSIDGYGFVSSSGFGDGIYNCWTAREENGYIVAIRVEFITEDDEDEEEEEYDNE